MSNTEKKRVLMSFYTPMLQAGVPHVMMEIIRNLHDKYTFDLLLNEVDKSQVGFYDEEFLSYGGKIYYCKKVNWFKNRIGDLANLFLTILSTYRLCKKNRYDVIHCHDSNYSGAKLLGARLAGVKKRIAHSHVVYTKHASSNPIKRWVKNSLLTKMTIKHSTDRLSCSTLSGESIFTNVDFVNVLNPVNVDFFRSIEKREHNTFNMLQIGYYCSNKNQLFSVELLEKLRASKIDAHLYFIGFALDVEYYKNLMLAVKEKSLDNFVHFMPSDVDKKEIFSIIDVSLLPSFKEGFSLTAVESQCSDIPCIASDVVCDDVDIGLLYRVNLKDIDSWINAISSLSNKKLVLSEERMNKMKPNIYSKNIDKIYDL